MRMFLLHNNLSVVVSVDVAVGSVTVYVIVVAVVVDGGGIAIAVVGGCWLYTCSHLLLLSLLLLL